MQGVSEGAWRETLPDAIVAQISAARSSLDKTQMCCWGWGLRGEDGSKEESKECMTQLRGAAWTRHRCVVGDGGGDLGGEQG